MPPPASPSPQTPGRSLRALSQLSAAHFLNAVIVTHWVNPSVVIPLYLRQRSTRRLGTTARSCATPLSIRNARLLLALSDKYYPDPWICRCAGWAWPMPFFGSALCGRGRETGKAFRGSGRHPIRARAQSTRGLPPGNRRMLLVLVLLPHAEQHAGRRDMRKPRRMPSEVKAHRRTVNPALTQRGHFHSPCRPRVSGPRPLVERRAVSVAFAGQRKRRDSVAVEAPSRNTRR